MSITDPAPDSPLPYFRGRPRSRRRCDELGVSYAILRPAVFFGGRDVLVNNIAWLLRRLPVFGLVRGRVRAPAIDVEDFARLAETRRGGR